MLSLPSQDISGYGLDMSNSDELQIWHRASNLCQARQQQVFPKGHTGRAIVHVQLIPIGSKEKAPEGKLKWFQELTVPTSLMISIYTFQVSNGKRNRQFRELAAPPLVELVARTCQSGNLNLNVPTIGGNQVWNLTIPASGQLPLACLIHRPSMQEKFEEEFTWMTQDWLLFKDAFQ